MNARARTEQEKERVRRGASLELMFDDWYFGIEHQSPKGTREYAEQVAREERFHDRSPLV